VFLRKLIDITTAKGVMGLSQYLGKKQLLFAVALIGIAILFQVLPLYNMVINGVFNWHIKQPEVVQGGIELLVLFSILALTISIVKNKLIVAFAVIIVCAFYLWSNCVLIPAMLALLYLEIIISLGRWIFKVFRIETENSLISYLHYFFTGFVTWAFLAISLSVFKLGGFNEMRIMTGVVAIISITKGLGQPFFMALLKGFINSTKIDKILEVFIMFLVVIQLAKTQRAFDYDSIWYGLRPEHVLIGENSFFDNLGLVQFVHYYPKLFELYLTPVSNLGDYSFILSANIVILFLLLVLVYVFLVSLNIEKTYALIAVALIGSLPVFSNMGSTAKTDIITTFFILFLAFSLWIWIKERRLLYLYMGFAAILLSFGLKLTSFAYVPAVVLGFGLACIFTDPRCRLGVIKRVKESGMSKENNTVFSDIRENYYGLYLITVSLIVLFGITVRTYILTGYPIFPQIRSLQNTVGFNALYPQNSEKVGNIFVSLQVQSYSIIDFATRWYKMFFDPGDFPRVIMQWLGVSLIFLLVAIIVAKLFIDKEKTNNTNNKQLLCLFLPILILGSYFITTYPRGGDSNYYLPPIIIGYITLLAVLQKFEITFKHLIYLVLILFIPLQVTIMFITHFSWSYGTRGFDSIIGRACLTDEVRNMQLFKHNGLIDIYEYISERPTNAKAVGLCDEYHDVIFNRLPCRFEELRAFGWYGNPELLNDFNSFTKYLEWAKIDYIIAPYEIVPAHENIYRYVAQVKNIENVNIVHSDKYYLIDISDIKEYGNKLEDYVHIDFKNQKEVERFLGDGWSSGEEGHRWTDGKSASLSIPIKKSDSDLILTLVVMPFISPEKNESTVNLIVNEEKLDTLIFDVSEVHEVSVIVPNILIENEKLSIVFDMPDAASPRDLGISGDTRTLGLAFWSITVEQLD
jgi:hypothetical protein